MATNNQPTNQSPLNTHQNQWLGRAHHMAQGATTVAYAITAGSGIVGATVAIGAAGFAVTAAGADIAAAGIAAADASVGAVVIVGAAAVATSAFNQIAKKTAKYARDVPEQNHALWEVAGIGLLMSFSLSCGIGANKLIHDTLAQGQKTPQAQADLSAPASLTHSLSVANLREENYVVVLKAKEDRRVISGEPSIRLK